MLEKHSALSSNKWNRELKDFAFLYFIAVTFRMKKRLIYITAYSAGLVATQTKRYRRKISFKNQNLVLK
jgi:hypothetical protein